MTMVISRTHQACMAVITAGGPTRTALPSVCGAGDSRRQQAHAGQLRASSQASGVQGIPAIACRLASSTPAPVVPSMSSQYPCSLSDVHCWCLLAGRVQSLANCMTLAARRCSAMRQMQVCGVYSSCGCSTARQQTCRYCCCCCRRRCVAGLGLREAAHGGRLFAVHSQWQARKR